MAHSIGIMVFAKTFNIQFQEK